MNDIGVGAVGAAIIAGLVSLLGLVIGKEQKVSEFRQTWIDDLRKCLVSYLVSINAISDLLRVGKSISKIDNDKLMSNYRSLNEAHHGVILRINSDEDPAKALLASMSKFEVVANANSTLTPDKIRSIEDEFIEASKSLLKFEWNRVKRGEKVYIWTKRIVTAAIVIMVGILAHLWAARSGAIPAADKRPSIQVAQTVSPQAACPPKPSAGPQAPRVASDKTPSSTLARAVPSNEPSVPAVAASPSTSLSPPK